MGAGALRLIRRTTLVVGKGGVGKSTVAAALALAEADAGVPTHLLSTDPAHSLADLFEASAPLDHPRPSRCTNRLVLEELDAERVTADRMRGLSPALRELIDRGTYLDLEDATSLLDATLPGMDEMGAALRIGSLAGDGVRLVVDTAPTGHTLRMLDIPATVQGWVGVFRAMAAKADAVATALVGRPVGSDAVARLDDLVRELDGFTAAIRAADFVVVTAPGAVVGAETRRLLAGIRERGLTVAATVAVARPGAAADVLLPVESGLAGCDALRRWWSGVEFGPVPGTAAGGEVGAEVGAEVGRDAGAEVGRGSAARSRSGAGETGAEGDRAGRVSGRLPPELERGLVVFAGKGGVGKTTCAAAAAVARAGYGRVVLMGVDPAGSLSDVLPAPPEGVEVRELDAEAELAGLKDEYRAEVESAFEAVGLDRSARMDREVVESLWRLAPPGIDEVMAVSGLADIEPGDGAVILDTAPTGHFLRLVAMPELALDWTHRLMRILLKYRSPGGLDAPAERLLRFARRFRRLRDRLADASRTAIVLVTLDEPVVHAETRRLATRLGERGLRPAAVLVNRATGPVAPGLGAPAYRAPTVPEPVGTASLAAFAARWERAS